MPLDEEITHSMRRVGQVVAGKYKLLAVLGAGGMGTVYRAIHEMTDRKVALKLLHPDIAPTSATAQRFLQEAKAPAAIGHPGIAEVLDAGREPDGSLYLVFELLEGEDLGSAVVAGRVNDDQMLTIAIE